MSIATDRAMDDLYHPEPPPSEAERQLVQAFRWGHIGLPELYTKLGLRALFICQTYGIYSTTPSAGVGPSGDSPGLNQEADSSLVPPTPADLSSVSTEDLEAELARRVRVPAPAEEPW